MADHARSPTVELESRVRFEELLADVSSRFINLPPGDVDHEVEHALGRVCRFLGIDLAVLWQWSSPIPDVIVPTHSYLAESGGPPPGPLSQEQFPWIVQEMVAGRAVVLPCLDALPPEASVDRENGRLAGVKSNLTLPLAVGSELPVGALGFNTLSEERAWPDELQTRLRLVAQVFTNALARKRADEALRESHERCALAADAAEAGLVVILHNDINMPFPKPGQEPYMLVQLKELFLRHHDTTIIWAHIGLGRIVRPMEEQAAIVERICTDPALAHVYMDISWDEVAKYATATPETTRRTADMLNRFPDRFLFGTDVVAPASVDAMVEVHDAWAPVWALLTPEASEKVRKGNYERLFDAARAKVRAWEAANLDAPRPVSPPSPVSGAGRY
jgi:PAS domain-containing protein